MQSGSIGGTAGSQPSWHRPSPEPYASSVASAAAKQASGPFPRCKMISTIDGNLRLSVMIVNANWSKQAEIRSKLELPSDHTFTPSLQLLRTNKARANRVNLEGEFA